MLIWPLDIPFSYPYNTLNFLECTVIPPLIFPFYHQLLVLKHFSLSFSATLSLIFTSVSPSYFLLLSSYLSYFLLIIRSWFLPLFSYSSLLLFLSYSHHFAQQSLPPTVIFFPLVLLLYYQISVSSTFSLFVSVTLYHIHTS